MRKILYSVSLAIGLSLRLFAQCDDYNDLRLQLASDEAAAYSLLLYTLDQTEINEDSLTIYSLFKFSNESLFPRRWKYCLALSELEGITSPGYYAFVDIVSKDGNQTILRSTIVQFGKGQLTILRSLRKRHCLTKEGSVGEYLESDETSGVSSYFKI